jgi:broad specificity phosphatase PhoE
VKKLFEASKDQVTRLILIRHGRTIKNAQSRVGIIDDTPLDDIGIKQARRVAERLTQYSVDVLFTSPITRARQTADIIGEKCSLEPQIRQDLIEYDMGDIRGLTIHEIKDRYPDNYHKMIAWIEGQPSDEIIRPAYSGSEPIENIEKRVLHFVDDVLDHYPKQVVCAVTHLAMIKGHMATLFGRSVLKPMNFVAQNTSITIIDFEHNAPILMRFNDCNHLENNIRYGKLTPL